MTEITPRNIHPEQLLDTYYAVLSGGAGQYSGGEHLRPILDPDLVFEGPIAGRADGAERFLRGVAGFVTTVKRISMLQRIHTATQAAALYDADLPGGTVRFAEFFEIDGGRVRSLRLLYDATEYRAKGGR